MRRSLRLGGTNTEKVEKSGLQPLSLFKHKAYKNTKEDVEKKKKSPQLLLFSCSPREILFSVPTFLKTAGCMQSANSLIDLCDDTQVYLMDTLIDFYSF